MVYALLSQSLVYHCLGAESTNICLPLLGPGRSSVLWNSYRRQVSYWRNISIKHASARAGIWPSRTWYPTVVCWDSGSPRALFMLNGWAPFITIWDLSPSKCSGHIWQLKITRGKSGQVVLYVFTATIMHYHNIEAARTVGVLACSHTRKPSLKLNYLLKTHDLAVLVDCSRDDFQVYTGYYDIISQINRIK